MSCSTEPTGCDHPFCWDEAGRWRGCQEPPPAVAQGWQEAYDNYGPDEVIY